MFAHFANPVFDQPKYCSGAVRQSGVVNEVKATKASPESEEPEGSQSLPPESEEPEGTQSLP
jgi:hypothetical protein